MSDLIQVDFKNGAIQVSGDHVHHKDDEIHIHVFPGSRTLTFILEGDAAFLTSPVQWSTPENRIPMEEPPSVTMVERTAKTFTLQVENSPDSEERYPFYLMVLSDGKIYSRDPVLINEGNPNEPDKGARSRGPRDR